MPARHLPHAELVVFAIPAQSLRDNLENWRADLPQGAVMVSLMKGLEARTLARMSEVIVDVTSTSPATRCRAFWPKSGW